MTSTNFCRSKFWLTMALAGLAPHLSRAAADPFRHLLDWSAWNSSSVDAATPPTAEPAAQARAAESGVAEERAAGTAAEAQALAARAEAWRDRLQKGDAPCGASVKRAADEVVNDARRFAARVESGSDAERSNDDSARLALATRAFEDLVASLEACVEARLPSELRGHRPAPSWLGAASRVGGDAAAHATFVRGQNIARTNLRGEAALRPRLTFDLGDGGSTVLAVALDARAARDSWRSAQPSAAQNFARVATRASLATPRADFFAELGLSRSTAQAYSGYDQALRARILLDDDVTVGAWRALSLHARFAQPVAAALLPASTAVGLSFELHAPLRAGGEGFIEVGFEQARTRADFVRLLPRLALSLRGPERAGQRVSLELAHRPFASRLAAVATESLARPSYEFRRGEWGARTGAEFRYENHLSLAPEARQNWALGAQAEPFYAWAKNREVWARLSYRRQILVRGGSVTADYWDLDTGARGESAFAVGVNYGF